VDLGDLVTECLRSSQNVGVKDDGSGGDNWSYKTCKAAVKSSPLTNRHPTFYRPDVLPVAQPTVSKHWREFWKNKPVKQKPKVVVVLLLSSSSSLLSLLFCC